ncbi:MAG: ferrochelatase, partial [Chloroflexota bacterium]|nr:ferrochelatase [Chloroflexota bacterium]
VEPYYTHIRHGRPPTPELLDELRERYRLVGGRTPLSEISEATRSALEKRLNSGGGRWRVFLGMKHWRPWIRDAVEQMSRENITNAVGLVLAPHYSSMSIAQYYGYVDDAQKSLGSNIRIDRIDSWHLWPTYLASVASRIRAQLAEFPEPATVTVLFTAHSLPQKILEQDDPYPEQLRETSEALVAMLDLPHWTFSYQSAGRTSDPWLGPDIVDTVNDLADQGVQDILVAPIGFVSDHLEIFYDIDHEAKETADARGITLRRTEMLNSNPDFVDGLAQLVRAQMLV